MEIEFVIKLIPTHVAFRITRTFIQSGLSGIALNLYGFCVPMFASALQMQT